MGIKRTMNILFVHDGPFRIFDNLDSGASVRNTLFVKALSQFGHVDVISFYEGELRSNIENCDVINVKLNSSIERRSYRGKKWIDLFFRLENPYTFFPLDSQKEKYIDEHFRNHSYDFVACRYIKNAIRCGLLKYREKLIIDIDDNPANAYKIEASHTHPLYVHTHWRLFVQGKTIGRMVKKVIKKTFCTFYSNPFEKPSSKSVLLYNTTSTDANIIDITDSTPFRILVVSWMDYYPNKEGCSHFVKRVFPLIQSEIPGIELHIAGKCSDAQYIEQLNVIEGVKVLGYVDDIARVYQESRAVIIPVYYGSGTSVKFIEGLMMNRPVVSTPMGARGFNLVCRDGEHFLLANNDNEFAGKVIDLLKDIELSKRLAHNALVTGREYFSQEGFMATVRNAVLNSVEQSRT